MHIDMGVSDGLAKLSKREQLRTKTRVTLFVSALAGGIALMVERGSYSPLVYILAVITCFTLLIGGFIAPFTIQVKANKWDGMIDAERDTKIYIAILKIKDTYGIKLTREDFLEIYATRLQNDPAAIIRGGCILHFKGDDLRVAKVSHA